MISYWIGYGTNFFGGTTYPEQSSAAWRIPLAIQLVPAIILCVGSWFLPFSPRWLMLVGREEESLAVNGAVFMVYWIIVNYALPYGPVGWVVTAESSSLDIRAKGIAIGSAVNWIMNFAVAMVTPVMLGRIGYKAFLVFMCFCALGLLWVYFVLPELKGLTLEEIDAVFADEESMEDRMRRQRIGEELGIWTVADVVLEDQMTDKQGDLQRVEG
jgi:hypothetical protein